VSKQKYLKFQVAVSVGNRKSQLVFPLEVEEDANSDEQELNILLQTFVDAIKALPTTGGNYTNKNITSAICEYFELQSTPATATE
jgi:hypothetical protein